jgi:hypothetical protein
MEESIYPLPIDVANLREDMRKAMQNINVGYGLGAQWAQRIADELSVYAEQKVESPGVLRLHIVHAWSTGVHFEAHDEQYLEMYYDRLDEMIDNVVKYIECLRPGGTKDALREFVGLMLDGTYLMASNVQSVVGMGGEQLPFDGNDRIILKTNENRPDHVIVSRNFLFDTTVEWTKKDAIEYIVGHISDCDTHVSVYFPYLVTDDVVNPTLTGIFSKGTRRWDHRLFSIHHWASGIVSFPVYGSTVYWKWVNYCDPKTWFGKSASSGNV